MLSLMIQSCEIIGLNCAIKWGISPQKCDTNSRESKLKIKFVFV